MGHCAEGVVERLVQETDQRESCRIGEGRGDVGPVRQVGVEDAGEGVEQAVGAGHISPGGRLASAAGCELSRQARREGGIDEHHPGGHSAAHQTADDLPKRDELVPGEGALLPGGQ